MNIPLIIALIYTIAAAVVLYRKYHLKKQNDTTGFYILAALPLISAALYETVIEVGALTWTAVVVMSGALFIYTYVNRSKN